MLELSGSARTHLGQATPTLLKLEGDVLQEMSDQSLATVRDHDGMVVLATGCRLERVTLCTSLWRCWWWCNQLPGVPRCAR